MNKSKKIVLSGLSALLIGGLGFGQSAHAEGVSRGELLASMCNTCHGTDGKGAKPNPSINGEEVADFVDLMSAFASGEEPATIMGRHASGYSEADLKALAEYFNKQ